MKTNTFKIYPFKERKDHWDKECWWTVDISATKEELHRKVQNKKCKTCRHLIVGGDCLGLTHSHGVKEVIDNYGNVRRKGIKGEIGVIYLMEGKLGVGVVSHECCHAMMYTVSLYTHVINIMSPTFGQTDEQAAQILGNLVNRVFVNLELRKKAKR